MREAINPAVGQQLPGQLRSVREGAKALGISVPTFWRRVADGTIPKPIKLGTLSRWTGADILGVIEDAKARRLSAV